MTNNINIYPIEIKDGLEKAIAKNSISFASAIKKVDIDLSNNNIVQKAIAKANPNQPDLFYRYAILASVGMNANDDVMEKNELIIAKNTPVDKQLNFMHDDEYIIGHMTDAMILDVNGNIVEKDYPDFFDIGVGFVLYTALSNEERNKKVAEIISEIDENKWFVSMECRFPSFDYGIIAKGDTSGVYKTVARNEESAFLTKHLRAYGGAGEYQDYKIVRILRNLFFSGIGIVDNPANKRSLIFDETNVAKYSSQGSIVIRDNKKMEEVDKLKNQLEQANATISKLQSAKAEEVTKEVEALKKAVAEQTEAAEDMKKKMKDSEDKAECEKKNKEACAKELEDAKAELAKANEKIKSLEVEKAKAARVQALVKAGLEEAAAVKVYDKWAGLTDEQFADIVTLHSGSAKAPTTPTEVVTPAPVQTAVAETTVVPNQPNAQEDNVAKLSAAFAFLLPTSEKK